MNVRPIKTRVFKEGEDLLVFIKTHVPKLKDGSILVVTSKIVALSEGRVADAKDTEKIIKAESDWVQKNKWGKITLKDGMYMWNAGIDASNADGKIVLLPRDSFASARKIHSHILQNVRIKRLGVIVTDSRIMPLRAGVVGVALGYAGFKGLRDYRGKKDIFGRKLKYTQTDMADALATTAIAVMGEGAEQQPLCVIEDAPVEFTSKTNRRELIVAPTDDMYRPLFKISKKSSKK